jgi:predicted RecA/RadA family phage recombinase
MSFIAQFVQDGKSIDYTPESAVAAGEVKVIGDIIGIAKVAIPAGKKGSLAVEGVFDVAKATDEAITAGAKCFWNATASQATATASDYIYMGECITAAAETDTTVRIRLGGPATPTVLPSAGTAITSLTDNSGGVDPEDDTIAAVTVAEAITDNSGGTDPGDDTIAVVTAAAEITDSSGGTDPGDDTIAVITNSANAGSADVAPVSAAIAQLAAKQNTTSTAIDALADAVAQLAAKQNTNSDAITALKAAVAQIVVNQNLILARLRSYGVIASE